MPRIVIASPAAPPSATAVPDNANGWVTIFWTNPGGSTANINRLYYRRYGTAPWYLLRDNIPAAIGSQQNVAVADMIALNTAYDYSVSAATTVGTESAMTLTAGNVTIATSGGGYTGILHIAGNVTAYSAQLMLTGGPQIKETLDAQAVNMFGLAMPAVRYGSSDYRDVTLKVRIVDLPSDPLGATTYAKLASVLAQMKLGQTGVFRGADGSLMTVGLKNAQDIAYLPQIYLAQREITLNLVQTPNQYTPSTTRGYALGFLQEVSGSVVPLNPMEQGI